MIFEKKFPANKVNSFFYVFINNNTGDAFEVYTLSPRALKTNETDKSKLIKLYEKQNNCTFFAEMERYYSEYNLDELDEELEEVW